MKRSTALRLMGQLIIGAWVVMPYMWYRAFVPTPWDDEPLWFRVAVSAFVTLVGIGATLLYLSMRRGERDD